MHEAGGGVGRDTREHRLDLAIFGTVSLGCLRRAWRESSGRGSLFARSFVEKIAAYWASLISPREGETTPYHIPTIETPPASSLALRGRAPMGNKAAGGPFQLEVPNGEAPGFHLGAMSGSAREQGCASTAVPGNAAADASDGSGDDERAYASPAEVDEEGEMEVAAPAAAEENTEDTTNFTRNNSRNSMSNKRLLGSPAGVAAASTGATVPVLGEPILGPVTADGRPAESVLPPPPLTLPAASASASPPRAPGCNDLQLPPLNDPHPLPGSDESGRLAARGSPNSADGRDQKGAQ